MPETERESFEAPVSTAVSRAHPQARWSAVVLGAALVLAVCAAGIPSLDAPWILGDEYIFIVRNPDVTGVGLDHDSSWQRLKLIFQFPPHEDLYQPLPILTYAIEWALWDGSPTAVRCSDVLLHALNALLLWGVLSRLLQRAGDDKRLRDLVSWGLALIWALHPALTTAYAADMGRTHLMSATFVLLSLRLHLRSLQTGRARLFIAAIGALLAAMLCKVVVGWLLVALVIEVTVVGWKTTLRSPRIYVVAVICVAFAALTLWTSQRAGVAQDAAAGLFGDPLARSALAVWIYARNFLLPLWLSTWHLPNPETTWKNPLVWVGLLLTVTAAVHAIRAWRRPERRATTLGWAWCWAGLVPVIGVVGAREAAATDRYLYQPLMGLMLVIGVVSVRWVATLRLGGARSARAAVVVAGLLGAVLLLWDLPHVKMCRSSLKRGQRIAKLNAGDPRALEALAVAYDFSTDHTLPAGDIEQLPEGRQQREYFLARCIETLRQAAATENLQHYFPGPDDRAPFHRRLSHMFKMAGQYGDSLAQAELARELQPDAFLTWVRLAHARQGLGQMEGALEAYRRCEQLLPDKPETRATHFTDFGYLLLFELDRADLARPKFQAAIATGRARTVAYVGLARCEIRVGEGSRGFEIISQVLSENPRNALAGLVLAEYHLRSYHWEEAAGVYAALITAYPNAYGRYDWYYEALRGFQTLCGQLGRWQNAALAWDNAVRLHPRSRAFQSFRVWSVTCAGQANAAAWADDLLAGDPDNPLACLAHALLALRQDRVSEAVDRVRQAQRGEAISRAREFERCAAVLRLLSERGELPAEVAVVRAAVHLANGQAETAEALLAEYSSKHPESRCRALVDRLMAEISDDQDP